MLYNILYWWFFFSQGNWWTKYLTHPKIWRPKPWLLMFASLVALDGFHLLLSTQLTADLTPEWSCGSMFHPLLSIYNHLKRVSGVFLCFPGQPPNLGNLWGFSIICVCTTVFKVIIPPLNCCFQWSRVWITLMKPLLCLNSILFHQKAMLYQHT